MAQRPLATQGEIYRGPQEAEGPSRLQEWVRRRLSTMLGGNSAPGGVRLCESVTFFIGLAKLRRIGNAWPTSRRMGGGAVSCRFGCMAVGGDDVRQYLRCPIVCACAQRYRAATPCWAITGQLRLALGVLPTTRRQTLADAVWTYLAYALFCGTHGRMRPYRPGEFRVVARAAVRSLCTLAPVSHPILFWDALAIRRRCRQRGTLMIGDDAPHEER